METLGLVEAVSAVRAAAPSRKVRRTPSWSLGVAKLPPFESPKCTFAMAEKDGATTLGKIEVSTHPLADKGYRRLEDSRGNDGKPHAITKLEGLVEREVWMTEKLEFGSEVLSPHLTMKTREAWVDLTLTYRSPPEGGVLVSAHRAKLEALIKHLAATLPK
jgi:hypothetical protein